ncbi:MAG: hypothetical protein WCR49_13430 [Opitutae bacterium]
MDTPGRPELPADQRHTVAVKFYLTDAEHLKLNREAKALGMAFSAYVRARLLSDIERRKAA